MQKKFHIGSKFFLFIVIVAFINGCVPVEKLRYFNDIDKIQEPTVNPKGEKLIMPFDRLYIRVFSIDEKTNQLFNSSSNMSNSNSASTIGYPVNESGSINYPFIGDIRVSGLTLDQASDKIGKSLSEYVSNAAVSVVFINNTVTLLGEVQRQGSYNFTQDKLNIYEALALGGGISRYGNRKNVILVRQEGDRIMQHVLDLSDSKIAAKDYYYIQSNDVLVVEPLRSSSWYNFNNSVFSTVLSAVTSILAITTIFITIKPL